MPVEDTLARKVIGSADWHLEGQSMANPCAMAGA